MENHLALSIGCRMHENNNVLGHDKICVVNERFSGFDQIIGQELAKRVLRKAATTQNPAHAYLFVGPEGIGKLTTAIEFAKALNCDNATDGSACNQCSMCHMIDRGNLPDVRIWSPEGKNTRIDLMREMRDLAMLKPMRARWKVNIVEQGDTLNEEAANCILKLIEEPPEFVVNILLYRNAAVVLPTIWSRCSVIRFVQVGTDELAQRLVSDYGLNHDEANVLACYAQGCPGRAIRLVGNLQFKELRDAIAEIAAEASQRKRRAALKLAERLRTTSHSAIAGSQAGYAETDQTPEDEPNDEVARKTKSNLRDTTLQYLDMLLVWYRDLLAVKILGEKAVVANVDKYQELWSQAQRYSSIEAILSAIEAIVQTKSRILGNANPQIATEALMLELTR
jgi:DNA polymerase-3 subunit delta'